MFTFSRLTFIDWLIKQMGSSRWNRHDAEDIKHSTIFTHAKVSKTCCIIILEVNLDWEVFNDTWIVSSSPKAYIAVCRGESAIQMV
jgi:hypothetical protein